MERKAAVREDVKGGSKGLASIVGVDGQPIRAKTFNYFLSM